MISLPRCQLLFFSSKASSTNTDSAVNFKQRRGKMKSTAAFARRNKLKTLLIISSSSQAELKIWIFEKKKKKLPGISEHLHISYVLRGGMDYTSLCKPWWLHPSMIWQDGKLNLWKTPIYFWTCQYCVCLCFTGSMHSALHGLHKFVQSKSLVFYYSVPQSFLWCPPTHTNHMKCK